MSSAADRRHESGEEPIMRPVRWATVAIWGVQVLVVWALGEYWCPGVPMALIDVVNVAAVVGGAVATWFAWRRFRDADGSTESFLDRVGFFLAAVFLLAIVVTAAAAIPWSCR